MLQLDFQMKIVTSLHDLRGLTLLLLDLLCDFRKERTIAGHNKATLYLIALGTSSIAVCKAAAGGSPVTSRISTSLSVSRDNRAASGLAFTSIRLQRKHLLASEACSLICCLFALQSPANSSERMSSSSTPALLSILCRPFTISGGPK